MKKYKLVIKTLSPLHLGNGQEGIIVDAEVAHDDLGLPYIPAKRIKGLLYESALELTEMDNKNEQELQVLFGKVNDNGKIPSSSLIRIDNLYLDKYNEQRQQWLYLKRKYPGVFDKMSILESYTQLRYQTAIDDEDNPGIAKAGSLHNMRVVDADLEFVGSMTVDTDDVKCLKFLKDAVANLRYAGAKRTRGCGRISCEIKDLVGGDLGANN